MDFASINFEKNADIPATYFVEVDGEPVTINGDDSLQMEIDLYGRDGEYGRHAGAKLTKVLDKMGLSKEVSTKRMSVEQILSRGEKYRRVMAQFYASMTAGWRNVIDTSAKPDKDGKYPELEFTEANATSFYTDNFWMMQELDDFLANRSNFKGEVGTA